MPPAVATSSSRARILVSRQPKEEAGNADDAEHHDPRAEHRDLDHESLEPRCLVRAPSSAARLRRTAACSRSRTSSAIFANAYVPRSRRAPPNDEEHAERRRERVGVPYDTRSPRYRRSQAGRNRPRVIVSAFGGDCHASISGVPGDLESRLFRGRTPTVHDPVLGRERLGVGRRVDPSLPHSRRRWNDCKVPDLTPIGTEDRRCSSGWWGWARWART